MGKRRIAALLVTAFLLGTSSAPAAPPPPPPLITNGDFESPTVSGAPQQTLPTGWSYDWQYASIGFLTGSPTWAAASGSQSFELAAFGQGPDIWQDVAAVSGTRYALSFAYSGDPGTDPLQPDCAPAASVKTFSVTWNGSRIGTYDFDTAGHSTWDMGWQTGTVLVDASGASSRVTFSAGFPSYITCGPVIDHVVLSTPASNETSVRLNDPGLVYTGEGGSITATVIGATAATVPTGAVQFKIDGVDVGSPVPLVDGSATGSIPPSDAVENSRVSAVYQPGSAAFSPSSATQSWYVFKGRTSTTLAPVPYQPVAGQPFDLTATVDPQAPAVGPVTGEVQLIDGSNNPLSDPAVLDENGAATFSFDGLEPGSYTVYTNYPATDDWEQSYGELHLAVSKVPISMSLSGDSPVTPGATYTVKAAVAAGINSPYKPTGTIQFSIGGTNIGDPIVLGDDGSASVTQTAPSSATTVKVLASYSGDDYFDPISATRSVVVRTPRTVTPVPVRTPLSQAPAPAPSPAPRAPACKVTPAGAHLARAVRRGLLVTV